MAYRRGQLPALDRYENALAHFNKVIPIRGRSPETKPLGLRRRDEAVIRKRGDDIECVLYNTPVLTYKPDDTIVLATHGYYSMLTASFISEVLRGLGMYARTWNNSVVLGTYDAAEDKRLEYRLFDGLIVDTKTLRPVVVNPTADTYHIIDRKAMKKVTAKYAAFIEYMKMMNKICEKLDLRDVTEVSPRYYEYFLVQVEEACKTEDTEKMLELYKRLATTENLRRHVVLNIGSFFRNPNDPQSVVVPRRISSVWDRVVKTYHADEIFKLMQAPLGKVRRDDNLKFFN